MEARRDEMPERAQAALDLLVERRRPLPGPGRGPARDQPLRRRRDPAAPRGPARRRVRPPSGRGQQPARHVRHGDRPRRAGADPRRPPAAGARRRQPDRQRPPARRRRARGRHRRCRRRRRSRSATCGSRSRTTAPASPTTSATLIFERFARGGVAGRRSRQRRRRARPGAGRRARPHARRPGVGRGPPRRRTGRPLRARAAGRGVRRMSCVAHVGDALCWLVLACRRCVACRRHAASQPDSTPRDVARGRTQPDRATRHRAATRPAGPSRIYLVAPSEAGDPSLLRRRRVTWRPAPTTADQVAVGGPERPRSWTSRLVTVIPPGDCNCSSTRSSGDVLFVDVSPEITELSGELLVLARGPDRVHRHRARRRASRPAPVDGQDQRWPRRRRRDCTTATADRATTTPASSQSAQPRLPRRCRRS